MRDLLENVLCETSEELGQEVLEVIAKSIKCLDEIMGENTSGCFNMLEDS